MSVARSAVYIVGAKRTPFGAFGGKVKGIKATDLAIASSKAAIAEAKISPEKIDETFFGNVICSSLDGPYMSRHVALKSGVPVHTPALTINRLCGSGFEVVCLGAEAILQGRIKTALCGGAENMSQCPMWIDGLSARWGTPLGKGLHAQDSLWAGLTDSNGNVPMGITAENLAAKYGITREQSDKFGLRSQQLYQKAHEAGVFGAELIEMQVKGKKGMETFSKDEHPRPAATLESLAKLKPTFKEDGVVTAASASGICDGAASLVVVGEDAVKENNLTPLSRVVAWSRVGCDPSIMGIGPVEAIRSVLKATNLTLNDIDLVEINEAFAAQYLACEKELGLNPEICNTNGGAIAVGHPLAASGARILTHLTHELIRTGKKRAIGAACIGGGQGIAVLLENAAK